MASNSEQLFEEIGNRIDDARMGKMFGCRCVKAPNGKAAILLWKDQLVVKPPKELLESYLREGYGMFTPADGRAMNGWIVIPENKQAKWRHFAEEAFDFVRSLPAKQAR